jgi:hypothetical protein
MASLFVETTKNMCLRWWCPEAAVAQLQKASMLERKKLQRREDKRCYNIK